MTGARKRSLVRHRERGAVRGRGECEPGVSGLPSSELPGALPFAMRASAAARVLPISASPAGAHGAWRSS